MNDVVGWRDRSADVDPDRWYALGIAAFAFLVRVALVLHGPLSTGDFDEGVYFGTANAFARGVVPYRDFVSVHPPFSSFLFAPTAGPFTALFGPHSGFTATRVLAALAGAITVWLLYRNALRLAGRRAAIVTSVLYATFAAAIFAESRVLLDPFMVVLAVGGATVFLERRTRWSGVLAGVLLGLSVSTKLTGAVFVVAAVGVGLVFDRDRRRPLLVAASSAATFALVSLPFVVLAGLRPWFEQVVLAQIDRPTGAALPGNVGTLLGRLSALVAWGPLGDRGELPAVAVILGVAVLGSTVAWGGMRAWRMREVRAAFWTTAAVLSITGLLVGPTFYAHYAVLAAVPLSVLLGGGLASLLDRLVPVERAAIATSVVAVLTVVCLVWQAKIMWFVEPPSVPRDIAERIAELTDSGCVFLDQPQIGFLSDIVPQDGVAEPLIDPFGELLELGRSSSHTALDALWSDRAQERLRAALDECMWVVLANSPDGQATWSPDTRARFLASHEPAGLAGTFQIWRTPSPTR